MNSSCGSSKFYNGLSRILGRNNSNETPSLELPNGTASTLENTADIFAEHFSNNSNIDGPLPTLPPQSPLTDKQMPLPKISESLVLSKLLKLKIRRSGGADKLSNRKIKLLTPALSYILPSLFNKSLEDGLFPSDWKCANVVPIFKNKGSRAHVNNYTGLSH